MARPAGSARATNTNRRFILLAVGLGLVGAILVYAAFSRPSSKGGGGAANVPVVVARADIAPRTKITDSMVEVRLVTADSRSSLSYSDTNAVVGEVTRFPIAANEQILSSKVVPQLSNGTEITSRSLSYVVPDGKRAMSVTASEVVGAGGLVLPGDYVDVVVLYDVDFPTKPDDLSQRQKVNAYAVQTLMQNIEVLAVSQTVEDVVPEATPTTNGQRARNSEAKPTPDAKTITLALTPLQAEQLMLAEGMGHIRLSVRHFGDGDTPPVDNLIQKDVMPQNLPNPFFSR